MSSVPARMIASASFRSTKSKYCRVAVSSAPPISHLLPAGRLSIGTTDQGLPYGTGLLWPVSRRSASPQLIACGVTEGLLARVIASLVSDLLTAITVTAVARRAD